MGLGKTIVKKSAVIILAMTLPSFFINWKAENLRFLGIFGNQAFMPVSIVIGGLLGLANIHGLIWSLEKLLRASRANAKLIFVSMFRLIILFAVIIALTALRLVNLLGLLAGMTAVFVILIKEGVKLAQEQSKEQLLQDGRSSREKAG